MRCLIGRPKPASRALSQSALRSRAAGARSILPKNIRTFSGKLRGVFHCFGGSLEQANEVVDLGHLVSFTGIVTFKNGAAVRDVAARIPLWKFMVETDCPYLAPVPFRGKRCEPVHTRLVAESIAAARGISLQEVAEATTETAEKFF